MIEIKVFVEMVDGGSDAKVLAQFPPDATLAHVGWGAVELLAVFKKMAGGLYPDAIEKLCALAEERVKGTVIIPQGIVGKDSVNQ